MYLAVCCKGIQYINLGIRGFFPTYDETTLEKEKNIARETKKIDDKTK